MPSPPITILVRSRDNASRLRRYLPLMLDQSYPEYEVLVAVHPGTDDTEQLLAELEMQHIHLRHIVLPGATRLIDDDQLALTIGIRAARHDWVVITRADCYPATRHWLRSMADCMSGDVDAVGAMVAYDNDHTASEAPFIRSWQLMRTLDYSRRLGYLYHADSCNLALRRSVFVGERGNSQGEQPHAEAPAQISAYVSSGQDAITLWANSLTRVAACISTDALVMQRMSDGDDWWRAKRRSWRRARRHAVHKFAYRLRFAAEAAALPVITVAAVVTEAILFSQLPIDRYPMFFLAVPLVYLTYAAASVYRFNRQLSRYTAQRFTFSAWWYRLTYPLNCLICR